MEKLFLTNLSEKKQLFKVWPKITYKNVSINYSPGKMSNTIFNWKKFQIQLTNYWINNFFNHWINYFLNWIHFYFQFICFWVRTHPAILLDSFLYSVKHSVLNIVTGILSEILLKLLSHYYTCLMTCHFYSSSCQNFQLWTIHHFCNHAGMLFSNDIT